MEMKLKINYFKLLIAFVLLSFSCSSHAATVKLVADLPNLITSSSLFHPFFSIRNNDMDKLYKITDNPVLPELISDSFKILSTEPILIENNYFFSVVTQTNEYKIAKLNKDTNLITLIDLDTNVLSIPSIITSSSSLISPIVHIGDSIYIRVNYAGHGDGEILRININDYSSSLIESMPGVDSSSVWDMIVYENKLYFSGFSQDETFPRQLWKYSPDDRLLVQLTEANSIRYTSLHFLKIFQDSVYFTGNSFNYSGSANTELFKIVNGQPTYIDLIVRSNVGIVDLVAAESNLYMPFSNISLLSYDGKTNGINDLGSFRFIRNKEVIDDFFYFTSGGNSGSNCSLFRVNQDQIKTLVDGTLSCNYSQGEVKSGMYYLQTGGKLYVTEPSMNFLLEVDLPYTTLNSITLNDNTHNYHFIMNGDIYELTNNDLLGLKEDNFLENQVVFVGDTGADESTAELFQYDNGTGKRVNLTKNDYQDAHPSLRPDGREIVYSSKQDGEWDLYKMDLDNKVSTNITNTDPSFNEGWPVHAPIGNQILYKLGYSGLVIDNPCGATSNCMMLMDVDSGVSSPLLSGSYDHAAWSPSASQVVVSGVAGIGGLSLFDVNSPSILDPLTSGAYDDYPVFANDAQYIVFASNRCGNGNDKLGIYYYDILTKQPVELLCEADADYRYFSFLKDGRLVFTKSLPAVSDARAVYVTNEPFNPSEVAAAQTLIQQAQSIALADTYNNHPVAVQAYSGVSKVQARPTINGEMINSGNKKAIVLTHGWNSDVEVWISDTTTLDPVSRNKMADKICRQISASSYYFDVDTIYTDRLTPYCSSYEWDIYVNDWRTEAKDCTLNFLSLTLEEKYTCAIGPSMAFRRAHPLGEALGKKIEERGYTNIHLIGHSAGSNLIDSAKNYLNGFDDSKKDDHITHLTFLDAYDPTSLILDGLEFSNYGKGADWVDNYVDFRSLVFAAGTLDKTKLLMPYGYNVDVTPTDYRELVSTVEKHSWPIDIYDGSIGTSENFGYKLSNEAGAIIPPLAYPSATLCTMPRNNNPSINGPFECSTNEAMLDTFDYESIEDADYVLQENYSSETGSTVTIINSEGKIETITLRTGSPVWSSYDVELTDKVNSLKLDFSFIDGSDGYLTVFLDGRPIYNAEQRLRENGLVYVEDIYLGELAFGKHALAFRVDSSQLDVSELQINSFQLEFLSTASALDIDGDAILDTDDFDDDGDGVLDIDDLFPQNVREWSDHDNDGLGDNVDNDDDNDGWADGVDNCEFVINPDQLDTNEDGIGDACDSDGDGVLNVDDEFPDDPTESSDNDGDGVGDNADLDDDNDNSEDTVDNCPLIANEDQLDTDGDLDGDECDNDQDNDGVLNGADTDQLNPFVCEDSDFDSCDDCSIGQDGFGELADNDPLNDGIDTNSDGQCDLTDPDDDSDGIPDEEDNCPLIANDDQKDADNNGVGDACEVQEEDDFCIPIRSNNGSIAVVCM